MIFIILLLLNINKLDCFALLATTGPGRLLATTDSEKGVATLTQ